MCDAENDIRNLDSDDAVSTRIRQLEEMNRTLTAEVERMRPVVEAVSHWLLSKGAPARAIALSEAYRAYESSKPE